MKLNKKLIFLLCAVLMILASCGKDNKEVKEETGTSQIIFNPNGNDTSVINPVNPVNPNTPPIAASTYSAQNKSDFIAKVAAGTFNNYINSGKIRFPEADVDPEFKFFDFNFTFSYPHRKVSSSGTIERNDKFSIDNKFGNNKGELQAKLVAILTKGSNAKKCYMFGSLQNYSYRCETNDDNDANAVTAYMITRGGETYIIDLNVPMIANPIIRYTNNNSKIYYATF